MRKIECIIFDLDEVLTDTSKLHYKAWKKLADEINVYFDEVINQRLKGISRRESLEIILELSEYPFSEEEKEKLTETKNTYYREMIETLSPQDLYWGVEELLQDIKSRQIKAVLASASKNAPFIIKRLEIEKYFDYIVDANCIKKGKPDPEIFIMGAENVQANPENCIVIEDSIAGLIAVKRAGMIAVGIGNSELQNYADYVFENTGKVDIDFLCMSVRD